MEVIKKQRLAVCRILLDVVEGACEVRDPDLIMRTRHYPALQREMCFADRDWEEARDLSVLACLVLSKELHYKVKMMIGFVFKGVLGLLSATPVLRCADECDRLASLF